MYSTIGCLLGDALGVLSCQFWRTALPFGAQLPMHTLASFFTLGVFECELAHRRSVAVLCMLFKIRCNPLHSLYGALSVLYVAVRVTCSDVVAHRYTYAPPCCRTSQYRRIFIPMSVSLWNGLSDNVFDSVGLSGFKSRVNAFLLA